jgi:hypothetical protein
MKIILISLIAFFITINGYSKNRFTAFDNDTTVYSKNITDELAGSAFRKRAREYFLIIGKDTLNLNCYFTEKKSDNSVDLEIADHSIKSDKKITYRQLLNYIKIILPVAAKEFNFEDLDQVYIGRIIDEGDLAIYVTYQYLKKFGSIKRKVSYTALTTFLTQSKLASDFNNLLKPYSRLVYTTSIEEYFFASKQELYIRNKIETEPSKVPKKIFDGITWLELKPKQ